MPPGRGKTSSQAAVAVNFFAKRRSAHFAKTYGAEGFGPLRPQLRGCPPWRILRKNTKEGAPVSRGRAVEIWTTPEGRGKDHPWGPGSVPKLLVAIFRHSLLVVASLAQRLPVVSVPEQFGVTAVGNDVVDHSGLDQLALRLAPGTQGVRMEESCAGLLPAATVSLLGGGLGVVRVERSMLLAVRLTVGDQPTTAGVLAWGVGSAGQVSHRRPCSDVS